MKFYIKKCAVIFLSTLICSLAISSQANDINASISNSTTSSLSEQRQKELIHMVKQDCGSCHGMTLKGGLGPELLPGAIKDKPVDFIKNTILYGRPGTAMPPWKTILTEQEALWISQNLQQGTIDE